MLTRSFMKQNEPNSLLAYTPMFHSRLFQADKNVRAQHFQPTRSTDEKAEELFLDGNPAIDRPLFVQFCSNDPDDFIGAAHHVAPHCDAVDLNLGCPQGIARRGNYGAFLQENWDLVYKLINRLHTELPIPVTAKFRIQETKEKTLEYAKMILSAGASIITVHGRRREQKGHNTGVADWSYIRYLRENLPPETVIFANGNILNHGDLEPCLEATGADGIMSAEGNLSDPTVFSEAPPIGSEGREYWRGSNGKGGYRMDAVFRRYLDIIHKHVLREPVPERKPLFLPTDPVEEEHAEVSETTGEKHKLSENEDDVPLKKKQKRARAQTRRKKVHEPNLTAMQGHLFQLLRPMVSKQTHIRDALAQTVSGDIPAFERVLSLVEKAVKEGIQEYEKTPEKFDDQYKDENLEGSKAVIADYGRPWWICQPYIRPLPEEAIANGAMRISKKAQKEAEQQGKGEAEAAKAAAASEEIVASKVEPLVQG